jgi:hypothetical protein
MTWGWYTEAALRRVEIGMVTYRDALHLRGELIRRDRDIANLIAIIEKEIDHEQQQGTCPRLPIGALSA